MKFLRELIVLEFRSRFTARLIATMSVAREAGVPCKKQENGRCLLCGTGPTPTLLGGGEGPDKCVFAYEERRKLPLGAAAAAAPNIPFCTGRGRCKNPLQIAARRPAPRVGRYPHIQCALISCFLDDAGRAYRSFGTNSRSGTITGGGSVVW